MTLLQLLCASRLLGVPSSLPVSDVKAQPAKTELSMAPSSISSSPHFAPAVSSPLQPSSLSRIGSAIDFTLGPSISSDMLVGPVDVPPILQPQAEISDITLENAQQWDALSDSVEGNSVSGAGAGAGAATTITTTTTASVSILTKVDTTIYPVDVTNTRSAASTLAASSPPLPLASTTTARSVPTAIAAAAGNGNGSANKDDHLWDFFKSRQGLERQRQRERQEQEEKLRLETERKRREAAEELERQKLEREQAEAQAQIRREEAREAARREREAMAKTVNLADNNSSLMSIGYGLGMKPASQTTTPFRPQ